MLDFPKDEIEPFLDDWPLINYLNAFDFDCFLVHTSCVELFERATLGHVATHPVYLTDYDRKIGRDDFVLLDVLFREQMVFDWERTEIAWMKRWGVYHPERIGCFSVSPDLPAGLNLFRHDDQRGEIFASTEFIRELDKRPVRSTPEHVMPMSFYFRHNTDDLRRGIVSLRDFSPLIWWRGGSFEELRAAKGYTNG